MSQIEQVTFVLENCESVKIKYPDLFYFNIKGVSTSYLNCVNSITKINRIEQLEFAFKKQSTLDGLLFNEADQDLFIEALCRKDITQIYVEYKQPDDASYVIQDDHYSLLWHKDDSTYSRYQEVLDADGFFYITSNVPKLERCDIESLKYLHHTTSNMIC